jgi:crotonobetainyl-CoA:carnitine CoA-transferase CaiB-like acyl-CoA transferase
VIDFLQGVFETRTQAEWIEWFRGRDVCFAPVKNLREAFDDPQVQAREMRLVDERGQEHIGVPVKFAAEPGRADFRLPRLGEHTEQVLRSVGCSDGEIAALREGGAF